MSHPHVLLVHDGETIEVDELLAPLVAALWEGGVETVTCCQGDNGRAFIEFGWLDDLLQFLNGVSEGGPKDDLYLRLGATATLHVFDDGKWSEDGQTEILDDPAMVPDWRVFPSVTYGFAISDADEMARRFTRAVMP